jgi:hypothetical protein
MMVSETPRELDEVLRSHTFENRAYYEELERVMHLPHSPYVVYPFQLQCRHKHSGDSNFSEVSNR